MVRGLKIVAGALRKKSLLFTGKTQLSLNSKTLLSLTSDSGMIECRDCCSLAHCLDMGASQYFSFFMTA